MQPFTLLLRGPNLEFCSRLLLLVTRQGLANRLERVEGVGWKLLPLRVFPHTHELALDNDCILWNQPTALSRWLADDHSTLMAEDVVRSLGQFQSSPAVAGAVNSGIRGLPPHFNFEERLNTSLRLATCLESELDEQGLQAVALAPSLLVTTAEVSICSPFWPRNSELGSCGAHFVGLNSKNIPWNYFDRPGMRLGTSTGIDIAPSSTDVLTSEFRHHC